MRIVRRLLVILALVSMTSGALAEPRGPIDREPVLRRIVRIIKALFPVPQDASEISPPHP